ncbi:hypothetical protein DSL64_26285 [Dyadobacter luteus]|jgi:hypothetical protein|uniref:Uncharacterized protein n=1 Tax=Dyadobacter luteus TaxID=2259619 RepID=A0A3D8Y4G4_9BACT|nr:hypothetical protein [Dyadobacter luteus]REA56633.1 hypothetical protein DSL64_26285 [Dyadobacter luteus]
MKSWIKNVCLCFPLIAVACSSSGDLKVAVKDSDDEYRFTAHYDKSRTVATQQMINRAIKPNRIFVDHEDDIDKEIKLVDGTTFHLDSSPGDLEIVFDKSANTAHSYEMIRKLGESIKKVVTNEE